MKLLLFGFLAVLLVWSSMAMPMDESVDKEVADALDARDEELTPAGVQADCLRKCKDADDSDLENCLTNCVVEDAIQMAGSQTRNLGTLEKRAISWREVLRKARDIIDIILE